MVTTANGPEAHDILLGLDISSIPRACWHWVWVAIAKAGGSTSHPAVRTAYQASQQSGQIHTDMNPPDGALIWLGRRLSDGNMDGDVFIAGAYDGDHGATDQPVFGRTGRTTIAARMKLTGRAYIGWTDHALDVPITVGAIPAGGGGTDSAWTVQDQQSFLQSIGLYSGTIDGQFGPLSTAGTRTFQGWVHLTVDGIFGPNTTHVAQVISAGFKVATVSRSVQDIQTKVGASPVDGIYGHITALHVYMTQQANGLVADAIYGPATDAKLFPVIVPPITPPSTWPTDGKMAVPDSVRTVQAVQQLLIKAGLLAEGTDDGVYGALTSAGVAQLQSAAWLLADGIWGQTSDGWFFPVGIHQGCDYSSARPDQGMLKARLNLPYVVYRYLGPGNWPKSVSKDEVAAIRAGGGIPVFGYEEDGKELLPGYAAGVRVAQAAWGYLQALGEAGMPIILNADFNPTAAELSQILDALRGANAVLGTARTYIYGGYTVVKAAFDAGLVGGAMQTYAWSTTAGVTTWDPRAGLQQWSNGQWGGTVDFTRAVLAEFGQTPVNPPVIPPTTYEVPVDALNAATAAADALAAQIKALVPAT